MWRGKEGTAWGAPLRDRIDEDLLPGSCLAVHRLVVVSFLNTAEKEASCV